MPLAHINSPGLHLPTQHTTRRCLCRSKSHLYAHTHTHNINTHVCAHARNILYSMHTLTEHKSNRIASDCYLYSTTTRRVAHAQHAHTQTPITIMQYSLCTAQGKCHSLMNHINYIAHCEWQDIRAEQRQRAATHLRLCSRIAAVTNAKYGQYVASSVACVLRVVFTSSQHSFMRLFNVCASANVTLP